MQVCCSTGELVSFDSTDWPIIRQHLWHRAIMGRERKIVYATTSINGKTAYMHRLIMGVTDPKVEVDHRDGDGLNNCRSNLRLATHAQNVASQQPQLGRSSSYKGVSFFKRDKTWEAYVKIDGKKKRLGYFKDEQEAARAYDTVALVLYGEFAKTNF